MFFIFNDYTQRKNHYGMYLLNFIILLFLTSCTPPVYQNTTCDIDEFVEDSHQIAQGKLAILQLESQQVNLSFPENDFFEETVVDGDELTVALYCPQRPDRVKSLQEINERTGFRIYDGKIYLPHLTSREIEVGGLTLKEVQKKIQAEYCRQLPSAQVFVNFKKRHERAVQIIGAEQPLVIVDGHMRLSEVLAKAGISPFANLFKSYVMRGDEQLPLDLYQLIHKGDESQNIIMRGGDQIFIAELGDSSVMVTGEVFSPKQIPIPYGFISLREALVIADGLPFTANRNCIQIIRGNFERPKIYVLKWKDIAYLPNSSLLLMPGDIVVVSEKPITQWNRFVNQLQPSTSNIQTTYNLYQIFKN